MNASFVLGIDPGKTFFAATLSHPTGERIWKGRQFDMTRDGFEKMRSIVPAGDLTIGVEASGRIDDNLMAWLAKWKACCRDRKITLIRINPGQSARFQGPKPRRDQTDGSDSDHIAEFTRVYQRELDAFDDDPKAQSMARVVNERRHLVGQLAAIKCRIQEQVMVCFPEFTRIFPDPFAKLARLLLREVPTARMAARRKPISLARIKGERRGRSLGIESARELVRLAQDSIASACEDHDAGAMTFLLDELELLEKRIDTIVRSLTSYTQQAKSEPPAEGGVSPARQIQLLDTIPGIGLVAASTLVLATRGLTRFSAGKALSAQWASCPHRKKTGTSLDVTSLTMRGDHKNRAMLYLATQSACTWDPAFAFHKWRMIQRGLCPQQAVCAVMNKMARVIWAVVAHNEAYDVNRMLDQIRIHHAALWKTFVLLHKDDKKIWKKVDVKYRKSA